MYVTLENVERKFIDSVLEKYDCDKAKIIAIMQDIQEQYRYLPQEALEYVAKKVGMSESKLYGVATFYGNFSLDAKGKYVMKVCRGTACHVRKSSTILQALYDATGTDEHKPTSDDGLFTLEIVSCLGACGLSPVVMVNDTVHAAMTPDKARALVEQLREEGQALLRSRHCRTSVSRRARMKSARSWYAAAPAALPAETSRFTKS